MTGAVQIEILDRRGWATRAELASASFEWFEAFDNARRGSAAKLRLADCAWTKSSPSLGMLATTAGQPFRAITMSSPKPLRRPTEVALAATIARNGSKRVGDVVDVEFDDVLSLGTHDWCGWIRREGSLSVRLTEVCERPQLIIRRTLQCDQSIVGGWLRTKQLVQFALGHRLLSRLRVLEGEDHHDGHGGARYVEDVVPPCRKPCADAEGDPSDDGACGNRSGRGVFTHSADLVQDPTAPLFVRQAHRVTRRPLAGSIQSIPLVGIFRGISTIRVFHARENMPCCRENDCGPLRLDVAVGPTVGPTRLLKASGI
jgi:hypothetical protein